jgi:hypothetical protein
MELRTILGVLDATTALSACSSGSGSSSNEAGNTGADKVLPLRPGRRPRHWRQRDQKPATDDSPANVAPNLPVAALTCHDIPLANFLPRGIGIWCMFLLGFHADTGGNPMRFFIKIKRDDGAARED